MGSYLWEVGGETDHPSINDQIMSGISGAFLGEPLFGLASLVLEKGGENQGFWRELHAALISPPTGFNRLVFGERFATVFPSHDFARFWRVDLGGSAITHSTGNVTGIAKETAVADFSLTYGLAGKPGYSYERPFDYFQLELAVNSGPTDVPETVVSRGLLLGRDYEVGTLIAGYGDFTAATTIFRPTRSAFPPPPSPSARRPSGGFRAKAILHMPVRVGKAAGQRASGTERGGADRPHLGSPRPRAEVPLGHA